MIRFSETRFLVILMIFILLNSSTSYRVTKSDASGFHPADIIREELLVDHIDSEPDVHVNGTSGEFSHSFVSSSEDCYMDLEWAHNPGTYLPHQEDPYDAREEQLPYCNEFIYFTRPFYWDYEELPFDVNASITYSVRTTGNFSNALSGGWLMFKVYVWLIDSSGEWTQIYRSYPPYYNESQEFRTPVTYFDIRSAFNGMVEFENGTQEDPSDTLEFAVGLAPDTRFYESYLGSIPWETYNGTVTVSITDLSLEAFLVQEDPEQFVLEPRYNGTWGLRTSDVNSSIGDFPATDLCKDLCIADDGSIYTIARSSYYNASVPSSGFSYLTLQKWDSQCNLIWSKKHNEISKGCAVSVFGNSVYSIGVQRDYEGTYDELLLTKWDSDGNIIWDATWESGFTENGLDIWLTDSNDIFVTAQYYCISQEPVFWNSTLLKFDSAGELEWNKTIERSVWGFENEETIQPGPEGKLYVLFDRLYQIDFDGNQLWHFDCGFESMASDNSGGVLVTIHEGFVCHISKIDATGEFIWNTTYSRTYSSGLQECFATHAIDISQDGTVGVLIQSWGYLYRYYLLKLDINGNLLYNATFSPEYWHQADGEVPFEISSNGMLYTSPVAHYDDQGSNVALNCYDFNTGGSVTGVIDIWVILLIGVGVCAIVGITVIVLRSRHL